MNQPNYTTLMAHIAELCDPRSVRGRSYEWRFLMAIICSALLCGNKSVRAMAQWAFLHTQEILDVLKPKRAMVPSASTLYRVLRVIDIDELESRLSDYSAAIDADDKVTGEVQGPNQSRLRGQSVDGKEVRGATKQGAPLTLVGLVRHGSGTVLGQQAVDRKTNEITVVPELLHERDLTGTVTTMDALLTQREIAQQILDQGGDFLMVVKRNQPTLHEAIDLVFSSPPIPAADEEYLAYTYANDGHGRLERRTLESSTALNDYLDWPGVAQVLRPGTLWVRRSVNTRTGEVSVNVTFAITSLTRKQALPQHLESLWRSHWTIENGVHYVRDESLGEDRSTLRSGNAPHAMAALRNAIISLLRYEGWSNIPDGFRYFCASLHNALHAIGALET